MTTTLSWTRKNAISVLKAQKKLQKNLAKVAQDELAIANTDENVESAEGTAGPQEVIEAIDVIVDQLEEVQEAIPGEVPEDVEGVV
ncbi:MAG: hypothetical protein IH946_10790 [Bacteroidetes bacterium]|nr:hypothetical protein [Bacteroidota bacterium]